METTDDTTLVRLGQGIYEQRITAADVLPKGATTDPANVPHEPDDGQTPALVSTAKTIRWLAGGLLFGGIAALVALVIHWLRASGRGLY